MDAISQKKIDILRAFASLVDSGADVTPYISSNIKMMIDCCYDENDAVVETSVTLLYKLSNIAKCRQMLLSNGTMSVLMELQRTAPKSLHNIIGNTMTMLKADTKSAAIEVIPAKKETRGVQLNMDGLLGKREHEDEYIKALLMVDGVTSVTIDRTRAVAIVYTSEEKEMKTKLYEVVQAVCDKIKDAAGQRRIIVKKNDHATYLDDSEDEDEDFFAEGSKKIVTVKAQQQAKTADDRFKERQTTATPASGGLFGWFGGLW